MAYIDYYKVLGITKSATEKEIKAAYRKMARKYHPDLHPNDTEANKKFQEVNEANEVLSDSVKRKKYDEYGENWQQAEQFEQARQQQSSAGRGRPYSGYTGGGGDGGYNFENFGDADFSDFFQSMFGGGSSRATKSKGPDLHAELQLELREAAETHKRTVTVNGKNIRMTIPAGVENGQTIRIAGHGNPGRNGGPAGDLLITFLVKDDPKFTRSHQHLEYTLPIDVFTAVLGGEVIAETLTGKVKVKVNPGTQTGSKIKLKGKGFPVYKKEGEFGDLYVTYRVEVPTALSPAQIQAFEALRELFPR